jgi:hypothetical protein
MTLIILIKAKQINFSIVLLFFKNQLTVMEVNKMSDFIITLKNGKELGVDDVLMTESGTAVKYIERYSHRVRMININEIKEIRRERLGWEKGQAFSRNLEKGWVCPI